MRYAIFPAVFWFAMMSGQVRGAILTLNSQPDSFSNTAATFIEGDYQLQKSANSGGVLSHDLFGPVGPYNDGGKYAFATDPSTIFTLSRVDGAVFTLLSVDLAELHMDRATLWATSVTVTGFLSGGGTVSASFTLDFVQDGPGGSADFQHFVLPNSFTGLNSVQFNGQGSSLQYYSLDNFEVDAVSAVPEPASMALWSIGGLGLAFAGFRRRKVMKPTQG